MNEAQTPVRAGVARVRHALGHGGTTWMVAGSLLAGIGAYLFQVIGARSLGESAYAPIGVLWTGQYLLSSILLVALESWVVRATTTRHGRTAILRRAAPVLVGSVVATATLLTLFTYFARDALLPGHPALVAVVPAVVLSYAGFVMVRGVLAGRERFKAYGGVTALESLVRLGAAVAVAVYVANATSSSGTAMLAWTLPLGALAAAVWGIGSRFQVGGDITGALVSPLGVDIRSDAPGRFLAITATANAAAQLLLAGAPLIAGPLGATPEEVAVLFITVTAARVPLVIVQGGLFSRMLPALTRMAQAGEGTALASVGFKVAFATVGASTVAGGAALLAGPPLVGLLFGDGFTPSPSLAAAATVSVVLATGSLILNQVIVAGRHEVALLIPWLLGLAVSAIVIVLGGEATPVDRVMTGVVTGEIIALTGLAIALRILLVTISRSSPAVQANHSDRLAETRDPSGASD